VGYQSKEVASFKPHVEVDSNKGAVIKKKFDIDDFSDEEFLFDDVKSKPALDSQSKRPFPSPRKPTPTMPKQPDSPVGGRGDVSSKSKLAPPVPSSIKTDINGSVNRGKFTPQTNGLVNGSANAGVVATSTLFNDSGEESDSDWDRSIEMANMIPGGSSTASHPRTSTLSNNVAATAKDIESKLLSRSVGGGGKQQPPAGAVDVGIGLRRPNSGQSQSGHKTSIASGATFPGDSDEEEQSEPFTDFDDDSKNSNGGITFFSSQKQPSPIMSSTLKTSDEHANKRPVSGSKLGSASVNASMPTSYTNRESFASVTSLDSETISDL